MIKNSEFSIPFTRLKNEVLGRDFELSLVFTDPKHSRKLNKEYRSKDKPTNVLSFLISKNFGEIFIDLVTARKEMKRFGMTFEKFVEYLYIHALLHLKGLDHGATMEKAEKRLLHGSSNNSGYRHRNVRN